MSTTLNNRTTAVAGPGNSLMSRLAAPVILAAVLVMLIVPLSPVAISLMFALNISIGLVMLAAAIYIPQPSEFLSFPSILLGTTLMRLALNVATARAILLNGYTGSDAAGTVIQSFGKFVVGGNYVVGIIIFGILITINFVVVTKGSSRVAEVSARFMLDSLPGRQMAIDADLNSGGLNAKDAERRRESLRREADFFGAMDGASKFVRGDVIAAMIILVVNLTGGLLIGTLQHGLPIGVAAHTYTLLTVGDGVAAQIPSLSISIAAGLIVTRVATGEDLSAQIVSQLSRYPQALFVAAGLLGALGLMPGMAHLPFLLLAAIIALIANQLRRRADVYNLEGAPPLEAAAPAKPALDATSVQRTDPFGLDIGFALVSLLSLQPQGRPTLLERLTGVRTRYSRKMGFVLPSIHIRDADSLRPQEYRFTIRGGIIASGETSPHAMLAIETDDVIDRLEIGRKTKEPVFGHDALWIAPEACADAETRGYTIVDPAAVIATHLETLLKTFGAELLGRREVEDIIAVHAKTYPKLIDDLRNRYQIGIIRHVLVGLVEEGVPINDFEKIAEALVDAPEPVSRDGELALAYVRTRIGRQIVSPFLGADQTLRLLVLEPAFDTTVMKTIDAARDQGLDAIVEPKVAAMLRSAAQAGRKLSEKSRSTPVLAVGGRYRRAIARALRGIMPVLALDEIPEAQAIVIAAIKPEQINANADASVTT